MRLSSLQKWVDHAPSLSRAVRTSGLWASFQQRKLASWQVGAKASPPPDVYKRATVLDYAGRFGLRVLVETGTFYGGMLLEMAPRFDRLYSIELDPWLHQRARRLFAREPHVDLRQGDSATEIRSVLAELRQPALFWLDAHYSGQGTAKAAVETPISAELEQILAHPIRGHVILIDDAHDFGVLPDYPAITEVEAAVHAVRPDLHFENRDGIIRIFP